MPDYLQAQLAQLGLNRHYTENGLSEGDEAKTQILQECMQKADCAQECTKIQMTFCVGQK